MIHQYGYLVIATYGFLKNICPDGYYLSNILQSPPKNLTVAEITQDAYPVLAYSNVLFTFVALLTTDILQYKTMIILGALASAGTKTILYFGTTITHIQVLYAIYKASNIAYRTYIYTKVKKTSYQRVTALISITPKLGTFVAGLLAQFLLSSHIADLQSLVLISLGAVSLSALVALVLPSVEDILLSDGKDSLEKPGFKVSGCQRFQKVAGLLWEEFKLAASNINTLKWCIWWIFANGAFQLVIEYYTQALWNDISGGKQTEYNAGVEALYAFCTTIGCFLIGKLKIDWHKYGEATVSLGTLAQAATVIASARTSSLLLSYSLYIVNGTLFDAMAVITNSQIALQVKNNGFGLIFGINSFLGILVQAALTYVLTSKGALALPIRQQFLAVGFCYGALGFTLLMKTFQTIVSALIYSDNLKPSTIESPTEAVTTISLGVYTKKNSESV